MDDSTLSKACSICKETLPLDAFGVNNSTPDRLQRFCRSCCKARREAWSPEQRERKRKQNADHMARKRAEPGGRELDAERQRAWKLAHPDQVIEARRRFRELHPDKVREWDRLYREANPDRAAEHSAAYYARNAEMIKARAREWEKANPTKVSEKRQRYRARKTNSTEGVVDIDALWTGFCAICGEAIDPTARKPDLMCRSIDHIIPLSKGGTHTQGNLAWAHLLCNLRKGNKIP